jgi:hypothetical protein
MSRPVTRQPYEAKLAKTRQNYLELIAADVRMCGCTCMIVLEQQDVSRRVWPWERSFLAELSLLIFNPEAPSDHQSLWPLVRSHFSMSCWQPALICVSSLNLPGIVSTLYKGRQHYVTDNPLPPERPKSTIKISVSKRLYLPSSKPSNSAPHHRLS